MTDRYEQLFQEHLKEAFGDRKDEFTVQLTDRLRKLWMLGVKTSRPEDMTPREEDVFLTGVVKKQYPATVGKWVPEWTASERRDRSRPPCPSCGGRGVGDYPFPCNTCGGSGNGFEDQQTR